MANRQRARGTEVGEERDAEHARRPVEGARSAEPAGLHPLLGLQASAGNAAVQTLLAGGAGAYPGLPLQRLWDTDDEVDEASQSTPEAATTETDGGGAAPEQAEGGAPAAAGPAADETAQEGSTPDGGAPDAGAIDQVAAQAESDLDPGSVLAALAPYAAQGEEMGDYELPSGETAQALAIQRDPSDPPPPRPGTPGDVLKALMPYLEPALDRLKANVLAALGRLKLGEKIAVAIVVAPIAIAPLTQPGPRKFALDQLNGTDVTFGVIPNLKIAPSISDGQLRGGTITYDLAPALRGLGLPF